MHPAPRAVRSVLSTLALCAAAAVAAACAGRGAATGPDPAAAPPRPATAADSAVAAAVAADSAHAPAAPAAPPARRRRGRRDVPATPRAPAVDTAAAAEAADAADSSAAPARAVLATATGEATYYADRFDGRRTASGIVFRQAEPYAAHPEYPFGTRLRVVNLRNRKAVEVQVVDRGPHGRLARKRRRIIDLSRSAAERLGFVRAGWAPVRVEVLEWGEGRRDG